MGRSASHHRRREPAVVIVGEALPDYGGSGANQTHLALELAGQGHFVAFASRWPVSRSGERVRSLQSAGVAILVPKYRGSAAASLVPSEYALRRSYRLGAAVARNRGVRQLRHDPVTLEQRDRDVNTILRHRVARWLGRLHPTAAVIHVIGRETSPAVAPLRRLGVPIVFTELGQLLNLGLDAATVTAVRADAYSADSRQAARLLEQLEGAPVDFIVGLGGFPEAPVPLPARATDFVVVSRLDPVKQVHLALEAVALVPGVRLDILGDGADRARVEMAVRDLGVGDRVTLHGMASRSAVRAALDRSHGFVLTSLASEGTPVAMLEAMSRGRPIVTTAVGGVPDIVTDGSEGLLLDGSATDLAVQLRRLSTEAGLADRLGRAARRRWETTLTPAMAAQRYLALYRHAVVAHRSPP